MSKWLTSRTGTSHLIQFGKSKFVENFKSCGNYNAILHSQYKIRSMLFVRIKQDPPVQARKTHSVKASKSWIHCFAQNLFLAIKMKFAIKHIWRQSGDVSVFYLKYLARYIFMLWNFASKMLNLHSCRPHECGGPSKHLPANLILVLGKWDFGSQRCQLTRLQAA